MKKIKVMNLIFVCCFLVALMFTFFNEYNNIKENSLDYSRNFVDSVEKSLMPLYYELNDIPKRASSDLIFMSELSSIKLFFDNRINKEVVLGDFDSLLGKNPSYLGIYYLDVNRRIVLNSGEFNFSSINFPNNGCCADLIAGEVYMSKPFFDFENNSISVLCTPLYYENKLNGFLFLIIEFENYDYSSSSKYGEFVAVVDVDGEYISNRKFDLLNDNFYSDYPEAKEIFSNLDNRKLITNDSIFVYRNVDTSVASNSLYRGYERVGEKNNWIIVSVNNKSYVESLIRENIKNQIVERGVPILFFVVIFFVYVKMFIKNSNK